MDKQRREQGNRQAISPLSSAHPGPRETHSREYDGTGKKGVHGNVEHREGTPREEEYYRSLGGYSAEVYRPGTHGHEVDWAVPGPYSGIGPKGYQRSSEHLRELVCERLERHGHLDASNIEVTVENCEVMLRGSVEDRAQKRMAEACAESVRGIDDVHNRLTIAAPGSVTTGT
jgi:osmotically-inducible protein OsmY